MSRSLADRAEDLEDELALRRELVDLLKQLRFHHEAQMKPETTGCSVQYHRELAERCRAAQEGRLYWPCGPRPHRGGKRRGIG